MIILAHGDCDGICSASIVLSKFRNSKVFFTNPAGLLNDLKQINGEDIIIVDIALTPMFINDILHEFKRISSSNKLLYFDHHPLPKGLDINSIPATFTSISSEGCASELVYKYFIGDPSNDMSRVMLYGCIGDYRDNTPFSKETLEFWDKRELYFEAGLLIEAIEGSGKRNYDFKRDLVSYLSFNKLPSAREDIVKLAIQEAIRSEEMKFIVKSNVKTYGDVSYVLDVPWSLGKAAIYARVYGKTTIGVAGECRRNYIDISVRCVKLNNLNEIVSLAASDVDGIGGGHGDSAGARIPIDKFMDFIHKLNHYLKC
ncbi:MAG: DHH family phosphoesterase [Candidatus Methanomethylicia archaeon]